MLYWINELCVELAAVSYNKNTVAYADQYSCFVDATIT